MTILAPLILAFLVGGLSAPSFAAGNEQSATLHFATLAPSPGKCPFESSATAAFMKGVADQFPSSPVIHSICYRDAVDLPRAIDDVLQVRPLAVAVWASAPAVQLLHERSPSLPIVFANISDPVGTGLVASLARPGGSITGLVNSNDDVLEKRVELLREALPHAKRLAILCSPDSAQQAEYVRVTEAAGSRLKFETQLHSVTSAADLEAAFSKMSKGGVDAVVVVPNVFFFLNRVDLVTHANRNRLPTIYFTTTFQDLGGIFIYSSNLDDLSYRTAGLIYKILQGTKPADIPVEQPTKFDFIVNAKTARDVGLTLRPSILLRATKVVEQ